MSFKMRVPAAVPSLVQSSVPWTPSFAVKRIFFPKATKFVGWEESYGLMSLTSTVPSGVPSDFQSSLPTQGDSWKEEKKTVFPTGVKLAGLEP